MYLHIAYDIYNIYIVLNKKCQWFINRLTTPIKFWADTRFTYTISETNKEPDFKMLGASEPPDVAVSPKELH
jgi:hypothetical protein